MNRTAAVEKIDLLRHSYQAEQFLTREDARAAVNSLFLRETGSFRGNATSVLAELLAMRDYPRAVPNHEEDCEDAPPSGCDFLVNGKRYQVKSIAKPNEKFLVNRGPHSKRRDQYSSPPDFYVFVRMCRIAVDSPKRLLIDYDVREVLGSKLFGGILRRIRQRSGGVPRFAGYIKFLPSDLGFPDLRRSRTSALRQQRAAAALR